MVKLSLDGMERSIVALRPGSVADLQQRIKATDKKLAKRLNPKPKETQNKYERICGQEARGADFRGASCEGTRAHDSGIEVVEVRAAYSSIIGKEIATCKPVATWPTICTSLTPWSPGETRPPSRAIAG
jgi:hypothetical protein